MGGNVARRFGVAKQRQGDRSWIEGKCCLRAPSPASPLAGCAMGTSPSGAAGSSRTVFSVAQPMLPIVGSSEMFPVRRIYCKPCRSSTATRSASTGRAGTCSVRWATRRKPWQIGKSFDHSAPMGSLHRVADVGRFTNGDAQGQRRGQAERRPERDDVERRRTECRATASTAARRKTSARSCRAT